MNIEKPFVIEDETLFEDLQPTVVSERARAFMTGVANRIIGQEDAVAAVGNMYQMFVGGLQPLNRPIGSLLFLGPTGVGKTRIVEAACETLFGDSTAVVRVDCAEFQHSHEIAKLIGAPPGYLGHAQTTPIFTQAKLDKAHKGNDKLTFVLFDEIEKASDALWPLMLGILDKASLTLGDNKKVSFKNCVVIMTSNLGAREMAASVEAGIGFTSTRGQGNGDQQVMNKTALDAAARRFSPEFMNRLDKVVVFSSLTDTELRQILELELQAVQDRVLASTIDRKAILKYTQAAKDFLLAEGTNRKYNARHLRRAVERHVVLSLSNMLATQQVCMGDVVAIDINQAGDGLRFLRAKTSAFVSLVLSSASSPAAVPPLVAAGLRTEVQAPQKPSLLNQILDVNDTASRTTNNPNQPVLPRPATMPRRPSNQQSRPVECGGDCIREGLWLDLHPEDMCGNCPAKRM